MQLAIVRQWLVRFPKKDKTLEYNWLVYTTSSDPTSQWRARFTSEPPNLKNEALLPINSDINVTVVTSTSTLLSSVPKVTVNFCRGPGAPT